MCSGCAIFPILRSLFDGVKSTAHHLKSARIFCIGGVKSPLNVLTKVRTFILGVVKWYISYWREHDDADYVLILDFAWNLLVPKQSSFRFYSKMHSNSLEYIISKVSIVLKSSYSLLFELYCFTPSKRKTHKVIKLSILNNTIPLRRTIQNSPYYVAQS